MQIPQRVCVHTRPVLPSVCLTGSPFYLAPLLTLTTTTQERLKYIWGTLALISALFSVCAGLAAGRWRALRVSEGGRRGSMSEPY